MRKQEAGTGHFNPDGKRETDVIWAEKQQLTKLKIADYSYYNEHEYCCMPNMMHRDGHGRFEGLTPEIARELMTGYPNISPDEKHNQSPTQSELIHLAEKYNGWLGGYVIPVTRADARITMEELLIRADGSLAKNLADDLCPDEFGHFKNGMWRLWWD